MAKTAAWQRKAGKNPKGGLNAKVEEVITKLLVVILKHQVKKLVTKEELASVRG